MRKFIGIVAVVFVFTTTGGLELATPQVLGSVEATYEFAERFEPPASAFCSGVAARARSPVCGSVIFFNERVATPSDTASVDVVLTLSAGYETSRGDRGSLGARLAPRRNGPYRAMEPGPFSLSPSVRPGSATASWIATGVEAAGRAYNFELVLSSHGLPSRAALDRMTVVIEMSPAGP